MLGFRKVFSGVIATIVLAAFPMVANAQKSPITIVVGFPPGGTSDAVTRVLSQKLPQYLGVPVMVDNKPGALGSVALNDIVHMRGRTAFTLAPSAALIFGDLEERLKIDIFKDLQPVVGVASFPFGVAVTGNLGVKTPEDLIAWIQSGKNSTFGVAGAGGISDLLSVQIGKIAGKDSTVVPYKGNGPMLTDLIAGHIPFGVMVAGEVTPFLADGKVRLVGMLSPKRSGAFSSVPTFKEKNLGIENGEDWYGIWAPLSVSKEEVGRMQEAVKAVLQLKEIQDVLSQKFGMTVDYRTKEQSAERLKEGYDVWKKVHQARKEAKRN